MPETLVMHSRTAGKSGCPRRPGGVAGSTKEDIVNDIYVHYSMCIEWSDEDQVYIVTVPELPGCKTHGATYEEAARRGQAAIETWIDAMRAWGCPVPAPRIYAVAS